MVVRRQHSKKNRQALLKSSTLSAAGRLRLAVLLALGAPLQHAALAAPFGSSAWFSQAQTTSGQTAATTSGAAASPATLAAALAASRVVVPATAIIEANRSLSDLNAAATAIANAQAGQTAAAASAAANVTVPDGLISGGLVAHTSNADGCVANYSCNWQNANAPTSSTDAKGNVTVTVTQTAAKAILSWDSFNIGQKTTLDFDQSAGTQSNGTNNWIALNRVAAGINPNSILGQIKADGTVYIIDPNGVIFGATSQVSAHSLLVSTLPLFLANSGTDALIPGNNQSYLEYSNEQFMNTGIAGLATGDILGAGQSQVVSLVDNPTLPGDIQIEAGADIRVGDLTNSGNPGYALFAAPNISNAGSLGGVDAQLILAAGLGVSIGATTTGSQVLSPQVVGARDDTLNGNTDQTPLSTLNNTGLIEAVRGDVNLLAGSVTQGGVVAATTSVSRPGGIIIGAGEDYTEGVRTGAVVFTPTSVTAVLPDADGETTTSSPTAKTTFVAGSVSVTGGAVTLEGSSSQAAGATPSGALIEAPGQAVSITALAENDGPGGSVQADFPTDGQGNATAVAGRVFIDSNATIDVAGLANIELPMSANLVTIPRLGLNELADSPLQRDGILFGASIVIDSRLTGTRSDGLSWVGTPLADLSGYVQNVPQNISELLQNGGNVSLSGNEVLSLNNSTINLDAGFLHYLGGSIQTTQLITANGSLVNIADADPNVQYVGIAGQYIDQHSRWNSPTDYINPILAGTATSTGGVYESDYIQSGNAGTLSVFGQSTSLLEGNVTAEAFAGRHQVSSGDMPDGGTLTYGGSAASLYPGNTAPGAGPSYVVVADEPTLASITGSDSTFTATTAIPLSTAAVTDTSNIQHWTPVSASLVADGGFSKVNVNADSASGSTQGGEVVVNPGVTLAVQPGSTVSSSGVVTVADGISLTGSDVTVDGTLQAPGGNISIEGTGHTYVLGSTIYQDATKDPVAGNVIIGSDAVLDASGEWVNDSGLGQDAISGGAYINGGSISITTLQNSAASPQGGTLIDDTTGAIDLQAGSLLNVSSGGRILQSGQFAAGSNNLPLGTGGSIALETYVPQGNLQFGPNGGPRLPGIYKNQTDVPLSSGTLTLDGTLLGYGFAGGGTLSLRTLGIQIGGVPPADTTDCNCNAGTLTLPVSFFSKTGFGSIDLQAEYNATIAPNTTLVLSQYNLLPNLTALSGAATGTNILGDLANGGSSPYLAVGQVDSYHRNPVNFSMYGGDYVNWITGFFTVPTYAAADNITGTMLLGADATIEADPLAAIVLGSDTQVTIDGSIIAHGGSITLTADTGEGGYAQVAGNIQDGYAYSSPSKSVWLDSAAVLDTSGIVLVNPLATPADNTSASTLSSGSSTMQPGGKVLAGGTITLTDDTGYVITTDCMDTGTCPPGDTKVLTDAKGNPITDSSGNVVYGPATGTLPAATLNVSGASGSLLEPTGVNGGEQYTTVASSAGTIRIGAGKGTYLHATLLAQGGSSSTDGGTLYVTPETRVLHAYDGFAGATQLTIGDVLPESSSGLHFGSSTSIAQPGDAISLVEPPFNTTGGTVTAGNLYFSPDLLNDSGISTLYLGTDPTLNTAANLATISFTTAGVYKGTTVADGSKTKSTVGSYDNSVDISVSRAIYLNSSDYLSSPELDATTGLTAAPLSVALNADYISIAGDHSSGNYPQAAGTGGIDPDPGISTSSFSAHAEAMDLGGQFVFDNFSTVSLASDGDMRLVTPSAYGNFVNPSTDISTAVPGVLQTSGTLNLSAAQIYPATDNTFVFIDQDVVDNSGSTPKTVSTGVINISRIGSFGPMPDEPLSAGGTLIFEGDTINQNGVVRAPDGQVYLGLSNLPIGSDGAGDSIVDGAAENLLTYNSRTGQVVLPVIPTTSVTLGSNSITSASLDGITVPYGATVDGSDLEYNGSSGANTSSTVTAAQLQTAPDKLVSINSGTIVIKSGATIDLSGGGDLQSQEWVAGTGGSRDVLSAVNVSYSTGTAVSTPLYADGRAVYAVIPGFNDPLGAYDSSLSAAPLVGQSVYLSGVAGLPSGVYTLLPAKYATLPGAYRVVQDTSSAAFQPVLDQTLADGTIRTSGYFVDSFTGAQGNPEAFLVQSGPVWQQYSQYQLTSLNQYFDSSSAVLAGAYRPEDAGQLNLNLSQESGEITLPTLLTAAPSGATGAELDIAAPDVQVADSTVTQAAGSLLLDPAMLDQLGVSRLVLGGISQRSLVSNPGSGNSPQGVDQITPVANEVDIDTPNTPLVAPEIVAVSQTQVKATESYDSQFNVVETVSSDTATQGVFVDPNSIIKAVGSYNSARDLPIQIGELANSDLLGNLTYPVNGDGSLLRISSGAAVTVSRVNVPGLDLSFSGTPQGLLTIGRDVQIDASGSVLMDASGSALIDPTLKISTPAFAADSSAITFAATTTAGQQPAGMVFGGALLTQLENIDDLIFDSRGSINFLGNVNIAATNAIELSAGSFVSNGGSTSISANSLMFANDLGATAPAATAGNGSLTVNVAEFDIGNNNSSDVGSGNSTFSGFNAVTINASAGVVGRGIPNSLNFGAASVSLHTPLLTAATGGSGTITTTGALTIDAQGAGQALSLDQVNDICDIAAAPTACQAPTAALPVGGTLNLQGSSVSLNTQITAPAGKVSLDATSGNLVLGNQAGINVAGAVHTVPTGDTAQVAGGGSIDLDAEQGSISASKNTGSGLDFAGVDGGQGGQLAIDAPLGSVTLAAQLNYLDTVKDSKGNIVSQTLNGSTMTAGQGGSFSVDAASGLNLDTLATQLQGGQVAGDISVHSRSGNLVLDQDYTLTGSSISLIADGGTGQGDSKDGNLTVNGELNAAGSSGGSIDLFARSSLEADGSLQANATGAGQNGGTVTLGTSGSANGSFNASYGYEEVNAASSGQIVLGKDLAINVAGGSGGSGGIVDLRAPLLSDGTVAVTLDKTASLQNAGARDVTLEAYATWSTTDNVAANLHFDGIIDPAGTFTSSGTAGADAAHAAFYTGTLMNFVENPGFNLKGVFAGISNFNARAGIDLVNPSSSINNGNISVLSDWNLGAGTMASNGSLQLFYRTAGVAPVLSLLASGNVDVAASLSDGFFQSENPFDLNAPSTDLDNSASPVATANDPLPLITASLVREDSTSYRIVAGADASSSDPLALIANAQAGDIVLSGQESSTSNANIANGEVFVAPTMIRTGVGSISLVAAHDFVLTDASAPGVVYTAGTPAAGTAVGSADATLPTELAQMPIFIDTGAVNPVLGGNISLQVGHNITGITTVTDTDGSRTGVAGTDLTQYWWPWMQASCASAGCNTAQTSSSINFGMFDQGIMSVGGNIDIAAGNNITDLSVSLPITWSIDSSGVEHVYGGGNLNLSAGGNLASGSLFLGQGTANVQVGGSIASDSYLGDGGSGAGTVIGLQNATVDVTADGYLDIGGIYNPSYIYHGFDGQSYSSSSSVSLTSLGNSISLDDNFTIAGSSYGSTSSSGGLSGLGDYFVLPASVSLDAMGGGITVAKNGELYPSSTGELSLLAEGDINFYNISYFKNAPTSNTYLGLIDAPASLLPSAADPDAGASLSSFLNQSAVLLGNYSLHSTTPLHEDDTQPLRIESVDGDVIDGLSGSNYGGALIVSSDKPAEIYAGRDLVNLSFIGQNLYASDVTLLEAARDLYDPALVTQQSVPVLELGGPGAFDVVAGRNLGPITSVNEAAADGYLHDSPPRYPGIFTVGNLLDAYLPESGADINIAFGVGGGMNINGFATAYIDPSTSTAAAQGLDLCNCSLVDSVMQYEVDQVARTGSSGGYSLYGAIKAEGGATTVTQAMADYMLATPSEQAVLAQDAWSDFESMPRLNQQALVTAEFYSILNQVGLDANNSASPYYQQYVRGYRAVDTLFPASYGYTENAVDGGANGAQTLVSTGNFDMRGSTVQTERGGTISILGPGGNVLVGSQSAPPSDPSSGIGPDTQGLLTLESGAMDIFTDGSVLLAQSRIFTEQGGDVLMWSSNGDINAGKGAKTTSEVPPPEYICDPDHYCEVDSRSQVSGAGIGVLQTKPGTPTGSANLIAPHGTVDAGDAGIRVSGNLNVAALHVANADNIQVQGKSVGVPSGVVDTGAISVGFAAAAGATQAADPCAGGKDGSACPGKQHQEQAASALEVEVMGYGGGE